jgi:predicted outer membrane repeat protein
MHFRRLRMEPLEDRRMLATFTVTNLLDGAVTAAGQLPGSLRQAIFDANAIAGADEIVFENTTGTINLSAGEYVITQGLTITGPGKDLLTIDAQQQSRIMRIENTGNLIVSGITFENGKATTLDLRGGAVYFTGSGTFSISDTAFLTNSASERGGAISTTGTVTVASSEFIGNFTTESFAGGGAIYASTIGVSDSEFRYNYTLGTFSHGGAIHATWISSFANCEFQINSVKGGLARGGAIYSAYPSSVTATQIQQCEFLDNSATGNGGALAFSGSLVVTDSILARNTAIGTTSAGGGIYNGLTVRLALNNVQLIDNVAGGDGGGAYAGRFTAENSVISGNQSGGFGGGVRLNDAYNYGGGISDTIIDGNSSAREGGGIYVLTIARIANSQVSLNTSGWAGGGAGGTGSIIYLKNSLITGNVSSRFGGGLVAVAVFAYDSTFSNNTSEQSGGGLSTGSGKIYRSTITGNSASAGASGIRGGSNASSLTIQNSIISGNASNDIEKSSDSALVQSQGFNIIGTGTAVSAFNQPGDQTGALDPRLAPLADNGGPTMTHALLADSPAFNAGDPNAVIGVDGVPEFDQRGDGYSRVRYGRMDIGAYESQVIHADFDGDGDVDGRDFLAWQRGYGIPAPYAIKSDGDADDDTDVDGYDLAIWQNQYSAAEELIATLFSEGIVRGYSKGATAGLPSSVVNGLILYPSVVREHESPTLIVDDDPAFIELTIDAAFDDLSPTVSEVADFGDFVSQRHKAAAAGGAFGGASDGEESL